MLKTRCGTPNHRAFPLLSIKLCQGTSYSVVDKECDREVRNKPFSCDPGDHEKEKRSQKEGKVKRMKLTFSWKWETHVPRWSSYPWGILEELYWLTSSQHEIPSMIRKLECWGPWEKWGGGRREPDSYSKACLGDMDTEVRVCSLPWDCCGSGRDDPTVEVFRMDSLSRCWMGGDLERSTARESWHGAKPMTRVMRPDWTRKRETTWATTEVFS